MFSRAKAWLRFSWRDRKDLAYMDGYEDGWLDGHYDTRTLGVRHHETSSYEQEQIALLQRIDQEEREQEDHR